MIQFPPFDIPEDVREELRMLASEADSLHTRINSSLPVEDWRDHVLSFVENVDDTLIWLISGEGPGPAEFDTTPYKRPL
jgi:hypothetical protein